MLKKPVFSKKVVRKILSDYNLGSIITIKPLATSGNITFLILTTKEKFILRICPERERWRSKQEIAAELELIDYLLKNKFPAPAPVCKKDNSCIIAWNNKFGYLRHYNKGIAYLTPTLNQVEIFGSLIGRFHKLIEGYKTKNKRMHIWDLEKTKKNFEELKKIVLKSDIKNKSQFIKRAEQEFSKLHFPNNLPKGMIHEDLGQRHILWKNDKISCVIDFDRCYYGKLILDLGQAIRGWCFIDNWKKWSNSNFKALLRGYNGKRKITALEKRYLFDAVKFAVLERGLSFYWRYIEVTKDKEDEKFAWYSVFEDGLIGMLDKNKMKIENIIKRTT